MSDIFVDKPVKDGIETIWRGKPSSTADANMPRDNLNGLAIKSAGEELRVRASSPNTRALG
jgi:hypothetical protein